MQSCIVCPVVFLWRGFRDFATLPYRRALPRVFWGVHLVRSSLLVCARRDCGPTLPRCFWLRIRGCAPSSPNLRRLDEFMIKNTLRPRDAFRVRCGTWRGSGARGLLRARNLHCGCVRSGLSNGCQGFRFFSRRYETPPLTLTQVH